MKSSATHQSRICFFHSRQHKVELAPSQIPIQYKQQCIEISRHVFARLTLSSVQAQTLLYENQSNTNKKPLEYLDSSSITLALHSKLKQIPTTTNLCSTQLPPSSSKYSNSFVNPRSSSKQARTCCLPSIRVPTAQVAFTTNYPGCGQAQIGSIASRHCVGRDSI